MTAETMTEPSGGDVAVPPAITWQKPHLEIAYRPDLKAAHLEVSAWTASLDTNPELRRELIAIPLCDAVRRVVNGSERRAKYQKLAAQKRAIQERHATAAAAVRRLKVEREFRLEEQADDFTSRVVAIDEQIAQQQLAADRAEAELRLIDPIDSKAYREALDEVEAAANAGGSLLVAQVRQKVEALKAKLFEAIRPQLDEITQLLVVLDLERGEFLRMARSIVFERDAESKREPKDGDEPEAQPSIAS